MLPRVAPASAAMWLRKSHDVTLKNGFFSAHGATAHRLWWQHKRSPVYTSRSELSGTDEATPAAGVAASNDTAVRSLLRYPATLAAIPALSRTAYPPCSWSPVRRQVTAATRHPDTLNPRHCSDRLRPPLKYADTELSRLLVGPSRWTSEQADRSKRCGSRGDDR